MEIVGALIAGAFIGSVMGFVGAGGAMLSVPILIYIFGYAPHHATIAALVVAGLAALSGAVAKARSREILYRDALVIWAMGLVTNIGFSLIAHRLPESVITVGFASVMTLAGITMLRNPLTLIHRRIPMWTLIVISLLIGSITGIFGIGGGFLAIPILVLYFGTPQMIAAGTAMAIIFLNSLTAFFAHHASWGDVDWHIPSLMAMAAIVISIVASHHGSKVPGELLRKYFAYLLFSIAAFTIVKTLLQF